MLTESTKVADLTVQELRHLIRQTVSETMLDPDPDVGLALREEFIAELMQPVDPKGCIKMEDLAKEMGFKWLDFNLS